MKKILFGILFILLCAVGYGLYLYNKPHKNVERASAKETVSADVLFNEFNSDETAAMERYADHVIEVSGMVSYVDLANENEPQIVLEVSDSEGFIRCGFEVDELNKIKKIESGSALVVKGLCKGFNHTEGLDLLSDPEVVISKCTIIE
ncbi:MAG: hypothetical protein JXR19_06880 [Bacteroidia bacterium]